MGGNSFNESITKSTIGGSLQGRWPANVILDEEAGNVLDKQSGITKNGHWPKTKVTGYGKFGNGKSEYYGVGEKDTTKGGASRFFYCPKPSNAEKNGGLENLPKVRRDLRDEKAAGVMSKKGVQPQQNSHPTIKPVALLRYLCRLVTPSSGVVLDCFMGSGSCGIAAYEEGFRYVGIEMKKEYFEIAKKRIQHAVNKKKIA